jgi:hypothetical protein
MKASLKLTLTIFIQFVFVNNNCFSQVYCNPSSANGCSSAHIQSVTNGTITNNSTCGAQGYSDYSGIIFPVVIDEFNSIVAASNWGIGNNAHYKFVDWNDDGDFNDSYENQPQYYYDAQAQLIFTQGIIVPAFVIAGSNHRMRISINSNPCNSTSEEKEDYTINVLQPLPCSTPYQVTADTVNAVNAYLSWQYASGSPSNGFLVRYRKDTEDNLVPSWANPITTFDQFYTLTSLTPEANYIVEIAADCGVDGLSNASVTYTFSTNPLPFFDLLPYGGSASQSNGINLSMDGYGIDNIEFSYSSDGGVTVYDFAYVPFANDYTWVPIPSAGMVTIYASGSYGSPTVWINDSIQVFVEPLIFTIDYPVNGQELLFGDYDSSYATISQSVGMDFPLNNPVGFFIKEVGAANWSYYADYMDSGGTIYFDN